MPKILKEEIAKPIGEEVITMIRQKYPALNDQQIRAVLNYAAKMTTPFVKKSVPVQAPVPAPVALPVQAPAPVALPEPVQEAAPAVPQEQVQEHQAREQYAREAYQEPVAQEPAQEILEEDNTEPSADTYL